MSVEQRKLHFSIEGEFITNAAREKCHDEGKLQWAIKLLMDSMVTDQLTPREIEARAYDILNGRAALKGTYPGPDYRLEYIPGKESACDLDKAFANLFKQIEDLRAQITALQRRYLYLCDYIPEYQLSRALKSYVNDGYVKDDPTFLEPMDADDAPGQDSYNETLYNLMDSLETDSLAETMSALTGSNSSASRIAATIQNPEKAVDEFIERMRSDDRDDEYGWLEPDGTYHPVEWGEHTAWAAEYLDAHYPFTPSSDKTYAHLYYRTKPDGSKEHIVNGDVLVYSLGWILIDNPAQGMGRHVCRDDRSMTKAQREFLYDYYTKRGAMREANALYENEDY